MKKSAKILSLVIAAALLSCLAVGFIASAETAAPEVVAKNVKVDGNFCLMFAVDPNTVAGDDVTLKIYGQAPAEGVAPIYTLTKAKTDTTLIALDGDGVEDDAAIVFETAGVSAKDIADTWWYTVESAGAVSAVQTYSVREYAFERLYGDNKIAATDKYGARQKKFYLSILEVGSNAQDLLVNTKLEAAGETPERLANQYAYAAIQKGTFGSATQQFVEIGDSLTLTPDAGFTDPSWKVYTYGTNGVLADSKVVALGSTITVEGNTVVVPGWLEGLTPGKYFADLGTSNYNFDDVAFADTGIYTNMASKAAQDKFGNYSFADVEGRGKVLSLKKDDVKETSKGTLWFPVVDKSNGEKKCLVAEFDVKISGEHDFYSSEYKSSGAFIGTLVAFGIGTCEPSAKDSFAWKSAGKATTQIASGEFSIVDETKTVGDAAPDSTGSNNITGGEYLSLNATKDKYVLDLDTWYKITFEWYDGDDGKTYFKAYIDGELFYSVSGGLCTGNTTSVVEEYDYNYVKEAKCFKMDLMDRFRPADVQIDNMFVGFVDKTFVK